jgi:hypothetical protein
MTTSRRAPVLLEWAFLMRTTHPGSTEFRLLETPRLPPVIQIQEAQSV